MTEETYFRQNKRLARLMRRLERARTPPPPVTYRRNRVALLPDGESFFRAFLTAIRSARYVILLEYYLIRNDRTGSVVVAELARAVVRGVRVMLIYDYIGCMDTPSSFFRSLAQQGIELIPFNVPSFRRGIRWFDRRDHRKMMVIDGCRAFLGGFNIGDEYAGIASPPQRFRDLGFSVEGSAVRELIGIFNETWQMEVGQLPELPRVRGVSPGSSSHGEANVAFVSGGPHQRSSYIRHAFLVNIASASEDLLIVNPYFVPGPRIIRSLLRAVRRGVRVRLLLPARSDVPLVLLVGRSSYGALLKGGVEIYELEDGILHAKVMLVDGERTILGSANLDQRSFHRNFEINGIIDSSSFGAQIRRVVEREVVASRRVTLHGHERRGLVTRMLEKLVNLFGWFL
ncbi:phospholipase D-like domain-containing protein [Pelobacter propionicus]|nr:phospholipase D-like domain-containing protein [Pelobacter propionicus]